MDIWTATIQDACAADSVLRVVHGRFGRLLGGREIGRPVGSYLFDPRGTVVVRGDRIVYGPGDEPPPHVHDPNGRLRRIIRWDPGDRTLEPGEAARWIDSAVAREPEAQRPAYRRFLELLPVADLAPAHDRVLLDAAGRLWAAGGLPRAGPAGTTSAGRSGGYSMRPAGWWRRRRCRRGCGQWRSGEIMSSGGRRMSWGWST